MQKKNRWWLFCFDVWGICAAVILTILAAIAAWHDLSRNKIPNRLILYGMAFGMIIRLTGDIVSRNLWDILVIFIEFLSLFFCLWHVYQIGGLGAGDCKLLLMTGIFLPVRQILFILITAFFLAAVGGVMKLLVKNIRKKGDKPGGIHFAVPVFLAIFLYDGSLLINWLR